MSGDRERFEEIGKKIKREADVFGGQIGVMMRRQIYVPPGALNTITPCAACKLLRRRCGQECPFFPYFPPHEPHKFAAVHKIFGASNVSKMLMEVPERQRAEAANSLVYEASMRIRDPVHGCMGLISSLQQQVVSLQAELDATRAEIVHHKLIETQKMLQLPSDDHVKMVSISPAASSIAAPPPAPPPPPQSAPPIPPQSSAGSFYSCNMFTTVGFRTIPSEDNSYFG